MHNIGFTNTINGIVIMRTVTLSHLRHQKQSIHLTPGLIYRWMKYNIPHQVSRHQTINSHCYKPRQNSDQILSTSTEKFGRTLSKPCSVLLVTRKNAYVVIFIPLWSFSLDSVIGSTSLRTEIKQKSGDVNQPHGHTLWHSRRAAPCSYCCGPHCEDY